MNFNKKRLIWNLVAVSKWKFNPEKDLHARILNDIISELEIDLLDFQQSNLESSSFVYYDLSIDLLTENENYFRQICNAQNVPQRLGHLQAYNYSEFFSRYNSILGWIEQALSSHDHIDIRYFLEYQFGIYVPIEYLRSSKNYKYLRD